MKITLSSGKVFLLCFCLFLLISLPSKVFSHDEPHLGTSEDLSSQFQKKREEIAELGRKLSLLSGQAKTLSSQINSFNTQIKLTELKIEQTQTEIATLSGKIGKLENAIGGLSEAYQERARQLYRLRRVGNPLVSLLTAQDFSSLLSRIYYLRRVAEHDQDLLVRLQTSQITLEQERLKLEELEKQLEDQTAFLSRQRGAKEKLLSLTRNDEKRFQELLSRAKAEQAAIEAAMRNAVALLKDGQPIGKGATIAFLGNSGAPGCSTGPHLHLEIQKDGVSVDPSGYLSSRDVTWDNSPDPPFSFTGSLDWPIDSPRITQGYGMTYWAKTGFYGGRPHTGIDMTSEDLAIRSPADGTLYKGTVSCGSSPMHFVAVDQGSGILSWYWHVQ